MDGAFLVFSEYVVRGDPEKTADTERRRIGSRWRVFLRRDLRFSDIIFPRLCSGYTAYDLSTIIFPVFVFKV